jgi:LPS-assembly lipoprotein
MIASSFALALATGGCFTPLYGEASHPGISEEMRAIEIDVSQPGIAKVSATGIAGGTDATSRVTHYLHDDLIFALNGTGSAPAPKYRLAVSTVESTVTPTIESQEGLATASITYSEISS